MFGEIVPCGSGMLLYGRAVAERSEIMSDADDQSQHEDVTRTRDGWRSERHDDFEEDENDPVHPVNPDWRSGRIHRSASDRRSGSRQLIPRSAQDIPTWLQAGGWRYVAGAAAALLLLLALILWFREPAPLQTSLEEPTAISSTESGAGSDGTTFLQPSVTPLAEPTSPPAQTGFVVSGTEGQGLFLRSDHDSASQVLETLPEGTRVEQAGEDFQGADRVWRRVRAPSGQEGWVAVDWLQPAQ